MSDVEYPQVGRGWAFPPTWSVVGPAESMPKVVQLRLNDGERHVSEAMVVVLRTMIGERVMRPGFGAGVDRYVFEARTATVCHRLADDVRRALLLGEPRIIVDAVSAEPAGPAEDRIDVTILYRIDRHRRPTNLVVPFHLGRDA